MTGHLHESADPPRTVEIADGVFAYVQPDGSWWLNNAGFVAADDVTVAVDSTSTARRTRALLDAIRTVSAAPVRTLVNTHHHGDHTNGNCLFDAATIVGHRNCRAGVAAQVIGGLDAVFGPVEWGDLEIRPPDVAFDDHLEIYAGDHRIELHYIGTPAHTTGDIVAWLPDDGVLFAGDLVFNGGTPFVLMGSVEGAIDACDRVRAFGATTIVPGHGEPCGPEAVDVVERYLRFVAGLAREATDAGVTALDAAREADLGEFAGLHDSERLVGNLHRAMAELAGAERGAPIDIFAAFADMITFNGGPLRCLA